MKIHQEPKAPTPLAAFCRQHGVTVSKLARRADMSTPHLFEIVAGRAEPKESTIQRLCAAAVSILGHPVDVREMFDLGEAEAASPRAQRRR